MLDMTFAEMVTQSVLTRALATLFLFIVLIVAIGIGAYDLIVGRDIPSMINTIIGGGVGYALTILGLNLGVILQPLEKTPASSSTPTPASPPGGLNV